jgi:L-histidine Nalpha-methyltransferase
MATTSVMNDVMLAASQQEIFCRDVVQGLSAKQKYLDAKYFYDAKGDALFQQIMNCQEYYPTACEMEIMQQQSPVISQSIQALMENFDVVELGAGDATKSVHLLRALLDIRTDFTYFPIDISANVIAQLETSLPAQLPALQVQGLNGEYMAMLRQANTLSSKPKVVLCMGGNIGNFVPAEARQFCQQLRYNMRPGDLLIMGFDLKKHPQIILNAYNDAAGITRDFNLNLLHRINRELNGNFDVTKFEHYPTYDPGTGACKSYLVSLEDQQVRVGRHVFNFAIHEPLYMEISQKYGLEETNKMAEQTGFEPVMHFFDEKEWFVDALWQVI